MRDGKVVNTYDVNPLSNHCIVTAIAFDHNEQLWFTVYDYRRKYALCTLDKSSGMVVDKCNDYGDAYALAVDNDNTLWVATKHGLLHYTDQSQTLFNSSNTSLTEDTVSDVKIDERNNIWFITDHNLYCFNRTTFTTYPIPYSDDFLRCFDIDGKDIYVGTHQHGMLSLTNKALTPISYTFPNAPTSSMRGGCVDKQGRFWAGTMTGAFAYNPTDGTTEILPMRQIDEIVSDNKGDVWLKPFNTGDTCLIEITPTDTIAYRYDQYPFNDNYICQMRFDHTNRLWLATTHGLIFRDNGQWHVYSTTNSNLPTNYIYSIDFDSQNNVWCGTFGAGLTCFNGTGFTTYTTKQGLESDFVATVCVDKNDVVWFNCRSSQYPEIYGLGLSSFHNGQFKTYTANNSQLASNTIWDIETDAKNNLWLATGDDKGVTQFDGTHWNIYNTDNSGLALNEATHIALDEYNRRIWFTCYTGGGVTYANLQYDNSAVTTLNASKELTIRNNHVLLDLPANVSVFDTTGHLILSDYGTNIDLSNLHRGIYIVHTSNTNYRAARIIIP
ncbi:MAG: T9SS type A sorting domain-containing protein [Bacteroidales bacterium]|nr:T9SS type A sorting domain-containing protein [Bacteroidales bacterium]